MKKKASAGLAALLAVSLMGVAHAADPAKQTKDVRTLTTLPVAAYVGASPETETAPLQEIYSTFSDDPDALYFCCNAVNLVSKDSRFRQTIGVPFVPAEDGNVRKIVLALSHLKGINGLSISLRTNANGAPGEALAHFKVADMPDFGTCCETQAVMSKGVPVKAGRTYWVVARALGDTQATWNDNIIRRRGRIAVRQAGTAWYQVRPETLPAMKVLGD